MSARWQRIKHPAGVQFLKGLIGFASRAPRPIVFFAFGIVGFVSYLVSNRDRRRVLDHLAKSAPGLGERARRRMARRVFVELYRNGGETLRFLRRPARELLDRVDVDGDEHLEAALADDRGVVAITGHLGAWELVAGYLAQRGIAITVLARRLGIRVLAEAGDMRPAFRALRAGEMLGLVIDQSRRWPGVWVPFLGRTARMPVGAAEFARRTGSRILPMGIRRVGLRHRLTVLPPVDVNWQQPGATVAATATLCRALESLIWRCPEQWTWMYDAWSSTAGGSGKSEADASVADASVADASVADASVADEDPDAKRESRILAKGT
jgi:KDO2-lipid IV(A) lauroyltransferase